MGGYVMKTIEIDDTTFAEIAHIEALTNQKPEEIIKAAFRARFTETVAYFLQKDGIAGLKVSAEKAGK